MHSKLKSSTLDQHIEETCRRVRAEFERSGEVHPGFECVTDAEIFHVPAHWPDPSAKGAACAALRDSFRRRGVNRYLFAGECWVGKTPGLRPADDPDRGESVQVLAVERNGLRRYAFAEIMRNEGTATLGPWQVNGDGNIPQSWLLELLEDGHSDRPVKAEPAPVGKLSTSDLQDLMDQHPEHAADFRDSVEIHTQLGDLIADQMQKGANGDAMAIFMTLDSVLYSIVNEMGSPKSLGQFAHFLRDHLDKFPMFPTVPNQVPSTQHLRSCKDTLQRFSCEKREAGHTHFAIFQAFMNMYMCVGSQAIGALSLADRIEDWDRDDRSKEIWQVENWSEDEWAEQVLAELVFSKAMNVQYFPECNKLCGSVAGYRVRRAPNGLVLVPLDNDEDIFVAVKVEKIKGEACIEGWLRGSEGKLSQFYQENCWVIPPEALHDMEELPGKEALKAMPPFQELTSEDCP